MLNANDLRELTDFLSIPPGHTGGGAQGKRGKAAGGYVGGFNAHQSSQHAHLLCPEVPPSPHSWSWHLPLPPLLRGDSVEPPPKRLRSPGINEWSYAEPFVDFATEIVSHYDCLTPTFLSFTRACSCNLLFRQLYIFKRFRWDHPDCIKATLCLRVNIRCQRTPFGGSDVFKQMVDVPRSHDGCMNMWVA